MKARTPGGTPTPGGTQSAAPTAQREKYEVAVVPANAASLEALVPALVALPLLQAYGIVAANLRSTLRRALARGDGMCVAAAAGGLPLGLVWYTERGGLGLAGYLHLLAVVAHGHHRGVGDALLQHFEAACHTAPGGTLLLCNPNNDAALRFYRRAGYRRVGKLPGFVRPAHTEVLLHKPRLPSA